MKKKYDDKLVEDYVQGNDIDKYDIEELENDSQFMMQVIDKTNDKKMYEFCSSKVKDDYEFIKFMIYKFQNDKDFIVMLADDYLKKHNKINCKIASIMTDFAPHDQWLVGKKCIDYFFVAHKGMKEALEAHNIPAERIHVTGIPLSGKFLKHYDRSGIFSDFHLNPEKKVILFFGGGEFGLGKTRTLEILSALISASDAQIVAIAGKNEKMKKHFDEISVTCSRPEDILVLPFTDKVPELMSISYLVVTKPGGLTTTESLASGLPLILINPIPGQEEENAAFLEKEGVAFWLRKTDSPYEALSEFFQNPEKIKKMRLNAKLHAKRNSTKDICSILLDQPS